MKTRRWAKRLLLLVGLLVAAFLVLFFVFPGTLLQLSRWQYASAANVSRKEVVVAGVKIPYYEGGRGEKLVLLHGYGDSKVSFLQVARYLTPHYHVLMPDLPGFGETTRQPRADYGITAQAKRLRGFFRALGWKRFHLGGNSMGGHLSAAYALLYPRDVQKLLLLNATGLKIPNYSSFPGSKHPIRNRKEFEAYLRKIFVKRPPIPRPFVDYFVQRSMQNFKIRNKVAADIRADSLRYMNSRISSLTHPTLVLWGDTDRLVPLRIGHLFHRLLPRARMVVMKKCGHSPQYERPAETASHLLAHLRAAAPPRRSLPPANRTKTPTPTKPSKRSPAPGR